MYNFRSGRPAARDREGLVEQSRQRPHARAAGQREGTPVKAGVAPARVYWSDSDMT